MLIGQTLWIVLVAYGCSFLGAFQVPVFLATLTYALVGVIFDFKSRSLQNTTEMTDTTIVHQVVRFLTVQPKTPITSPSTSFCDDDLNRGDSAESSPKTKMHLNVKTPTDYSNLMPKAEKKSQSEIYFKALFLACVATIFYKHVWMLFIAFIPIFIFIAKKGIVAFRVKENLTENLIELTAGTRVNIVKKNIFLINVYDFWL